MQTLYTTRLLSPDEWRIFKDLRLSALQESPNAFGGTYSDEHIQEESWWRAFIQDCHIHGLFHETNLIGMIGYIYPSKYSDDRALPVSVYIQPGFRGHGLSKMMMDAIKGHIMKTTSAVGIDLDHAHDNKRAGIVYEAYGFRPSKENPPPLRRRDGTEIPIRLYHLNF